MSQKSTSIAELQQGEEQNVDLQNIIQDIEQDPNAQQQQQQQVFDPATQQQQMYEPPQQMFQPPPMPPPMMKPQGNMLDSLLGELKDALIVAIVVIIINFEPVSAALGGVFNKVSENPMLHIVLKGAVAGVAFYAAKKLVLNK